MLKSLQNVINVSNIVILAAISAGSSFALTENEEVNQRLKAFYSSSNPAAMSQRLPKFDAKTGAEAPENRKLKLIDSNGSALEQLAGQKGTDAYSTQYCKQVLDKKFPQLKCSSPEGRSAVEGNDELEDLTDSWIANPTHSLDKIKTSGETAIKLWSDDYWRIQWGVTSYRYADGIQFPNYKKAVAAYTQPSEWIQALKDLSPKELRAKIVEWSPAEKYDLTTGDQKFTLTNEQKEEGQSNIGSNGDVESWMGICHGWSAAAIAVPIPEKEVVVTGAEGSKVEWYPADIRAMASLAFANGRSDSNFIGGRCNSKKPRTLANGRLAEQDCFDNNPATFHLALGNMIGNAKTSFVMDKTFDYEVWNQPIASYEFTYFNPLDPSKQSKKWNTVAVDYDATFKKTDRFQKPLTRGTRVGTRFNDKKIEKVVGVIARVVYLAEISPSHSTTADDSRLISETYTYDLELQQDGSEWIATGGEWHENSHPDFLWVPKKGAVAKNNFDRVKIAYDGKSEPSEELTETAQSASQNGTPLCTVLSYLVGKSSGKSTYVCR